MTRAALVLLLVAGCSSYQSELRASFTGLNAAHAGFVAWDRQHELDIVKASTTPDAYKTSIADYRAERAKVQAVEVIAYQALAAAAMSPSDVTVGAMLADVAALEAALKALGVPLPGGL